MLTISLPASELRGHSESVLRAQVAVAFHRGQYRELYNLLESNNFSPQYHPELQTLWYRAHYKVSLEQIIAFTLPLKKLEHF